MGNKTEYGPIEGNLEISTIVENDHTKIMIHGDPDGLKSLGKILISISELDQNQFKGLPVGESIHIHISPNYHLTKSSYETIIGRLDKKGDNLS